MVDRDHSIGATEEEEEEILLFDFLNRTRRRKKKLTSALMNQSNLSLDRILLVNLRTNKIN